ncbi:Membrane protein of ER body-like protein [Quillaja saponaria]|uniref:Membrane protein of ER body-like protein n=1 Tax=Quillaja saponaria TaxID=32244 RepID=A0AAD7KMZ0_QUISA|nr:Membrane protein of ER body-like protein [Quillaja saponaria]
MHESSALNHQGVDAVICETLLPDKQLEIKIENPGFQNGHKKVDIHKNDEILFSASVPPVYNNDFTTGRPRIENEREVTDLYLENVYHEKPPTHAFYCPNCKACIEKVIILPAKPKQTESIRCTKCLSFLIPIGNWLFPNWVVPIDEEPSSPPGAGNNVGIKPNVVLPSSSLHPNQAPQDPTTNAASSASNAAAIAGRPGDGVNGYVGGKPFKLEPIAPAGSKKPAQRPGDNTEEEGNNEGSNFENGSTKLPSKSTVLFPIKPSEPTNLEGQKTGTKPAVIVIPNTARNQEPGGGKMWEVLKSIVYGGLLEAIASLGVVTSAASADATTLNIIVLAFANLITGLFVLVNNIWEMKAYQPRRSNNEQDAVVVDRYKELLGERNNFILHAFVSILSFLIFGLVPPVVYGFSFFESDKKDIKLAAVAGASLLCITLLAIAKAYIQKATFKTYFTTVLYYVSTGAVASTVSYLAGVLIKKLIEKLGWFESSPNFALPQIPQMSMNKFTWASY